MKRRFLVLMLAAALIISVASVASAAKFPNAQAAGILDLLPEIPEMKTKNDGSTQSVTLSAPMEWLCAIWNWNWVQMEWTNGDHTEASVPMSGQSNTQQGYGIWVNANFDDEGNVTWQGTGTYEMPYAYDGGLADGTNVKFDRFGNPVQVTIEKSGTEYFANGASTKTTIVFGHQDDSEGSKKYYVANVKEEYADGSYIFGHFAMNGDPTSVYLIDASGAYKLLYERPKPQGERPSHCIVWWIAYDTPDSEIDVPENGFIKVIEGEYIYHGGVWDQDLNDGAGGNVEIALSEAEYADQANWPKIGYNTWSLWWTEYTGYKQVWVYDD